MKTMCPPGYHHSVFVATHALGGHIVFMIAYIYVAIYILFRFLQLIPASIYLTEDFGSSEFPTLAGKFECLDTAGAGTFYKVEDETKENIPTLPYGHHPSSSSQVNLGGSGSFRCNSSGGINNLPPSNR